MAKKTGWQPMPLGLKILFVLLILWALGSIMAVPMRYSAGLPFIGMMHYGIIASLVVLLLDVIAPLTLAFGIWNKESWSDTFAISYMSLFLINGALTLLFFSAQLGMQAIIIPNLVTAIFLAIILYNKNYFK